LKPKKEIHRRETLVFRLDCKKRMPKTPLGLGAIETEDPIRAVSRCVAQKVESPSRAMLDLENATHVSVSGFDNLPCGALKCRSTLRKIFDGFDQSDRIFDGSLFVDTVAQIEDMPRSTGHGRQQRIGLSAYHVGV